MNRRLLNLFVMLILGCGLGFGSDAKAEGSAQVGTNQGLQSSTVMFVDIVDASVERIQVGPEVASCV
ncbi:MAG: hypothetical protein R3E66_02365 [bacterium]